MSSLIVGNITDGTNSVATALRMTGNAAAWVNFNGSGTVTIREKVRWQLYYGFGHRKTKLKYRRDGEHQLLY